MKILHLLFALFITTSLSAMDASVTLQKFQTDKQSYVEMYLHLVGGTVHYSRVDSMAIQARVEVTVVFKQGDKIVKFDKFDLNSPMASTPLDFVDLKRYALDNGAYSAEITIKDLNNDADTRTFNETFELQFEPTSLVQSDIQLIRKLEKATDDSATPLVKHGYYMENLPFQFADKYTENLYFFHEIYNSDKAIGDDFMISYIVATAPSQGEAKTKIIGHKKRKASPQDIILLNVDISQLESGPYHLIIEVRNRAQELLSSTKTPFDRSNPYLEVLEEEVKETDISDAFVQLMTEDELNYSLKAIKTQVFQKDVEALDYIIRKGKVESKKLYLFSFWANQNPNNPQATHDEYMAVAKAVDDTFGGGFRHGFESDRGRIFMKYGKPNDRIVEENEPMAPPYEVWVYYDFPMTGQTNVKFIFYNPALESDFTLLHSTARGERNNPQWEIDLYRDAPEGERDGNNFIDGNTMKDGIYRRAREIFGDN